MLPTQVLFVGNATVQVIQAFGDCKDQDCDDLACWVGLFPQIVVLEGVFPAQGSSRDTVFGPRLPGHAGCQWHAVLPRARPGPARRLKRLQA